MGITYHYLDSNWCMQSLMGDVAYMPQKHTGEELGKVIMSHVSKKIPQNCLISTIVTDSDAKYIKACRSILRGCQDETLVDQRDDDEFFQNNELFGWRCFDHLLNLVIQNVIDDETLLISRDIARLQYFVVKIRSSPILSQMFYEFMKESGELLHSLVQDVITRWNSTFFMIESVLKVRENFLKFLNLSSISDHFKTGEQDYPLPDECLFG